MNAHRLLSLSLAVVASAACAGAAAVPEAPPTAPEPSGTARPTPKSRVADLASAPVYDAAGHAGPCAPPLPTCPPATPGQQSSESAARTSSEREFLDRCRLAGFQIRQCGCEQRCSGDVTAATRHYDAAGNPKECPPARAECTPPPAPAAFQDACAEKGHRLDVCGCTWLCSGNPTR